MPWSKIQKEARDRYLDLDRRVSELTKQTECCDNTRLPIRHAKSGLRPLLQPGGRMRLITRMLSQAVRDRRFKKP